MWFLRQCPELAEGALVDKYLNTISVQSTHYFPHICNSSTGAVQILDKSDFGQTEFTKI